MKSKRRKTRSAEPRSLTARIVSAAPSYFIAERQGALGAVNDEAILNVIGLIDTISPQHKEHLGQEIEISLMCARTFAAEGRTPTSDRSFFLPLHLGRSRRSIAAYMPADAFWWLCAMIGSGTLAYIEADFAPPRRGGSDLLNLNFSSGRKPTSTVLTLDEAFIDLLEPPADQEDRGAS
jgi:hypothetical protein